jgi:type I restriction enzyme S subunit
VAFEGKLVPQDPNDEPADKLLERIKAERAKSKSEKDINKKKMKPKQLELSTYVK